MYFTQNWREREREKKNLNWGIFINSSKNEDFLFKNKLLIFVIKFCKIKLKMDKVKVFREGFENKFRNKYDLYLLLRYDRIIFFGNVKIFCWNSSCILLKWY